jgi:hypothetical protein
LDYLCDYSHHRNNDLHKRQITLLKRDPPSYLMG